MAARTGDALAPTVLKGPVVSAAPHPPYEPFTVGVTPDRREVVVVPRGELDLVTVDAVEREVRELRDAGFAQVVIDLRRVTFMDSSGLQLLVGLRNAAARSGHRLTLMPGAKAVQRLFLITGTYGLFEWRTGRTVAAVRRR